MIQTDNAANVLLEKKEGKWYIISSAPCTVVIGDKKIKSDASSEPMLLRIWCFIGNKEKLYILSVVWYIMA